MVDRTQVIDRKMHLPTARMVSMVSKIHLQVRLPPDEKMDSFIVDLLLNRFIHFDRAVPPSNRDLPRTAAHRELGIPLACAEHVQTTVNRFTIFYLHFLS